MNNWVVVPILNSAPTFSLYRNFCEENEEKKLQLKKKIQLLNHHHPTLYQCYISLFSEGEICVLSEMRITTRQQQNSTQSYYDEKTKKEY